MAKFLLYPHQLFTDVKPLEGHAVYLLEEPLFFSTECFHIQKLILLRASMKNHQTFLDHSGVMSFYVDHTEVESFYDSLNPDEPISTYSVEDDWLEQKLTKRFPDITFQASPYFLLERVTEDEPLFMYRFYIRRRQERNLWIDGEGKPVGGKWSFDSENRKKLPKGMAEDPMPVYESPAVQDAENYVRKNLDFCGEAENFHYPATRDEALDGLRHFVESALHKYGDYQDAMVQGNSPLYHSLLSSSVNIGLLTPQEVIDAVIQTDAPMNAKEGFVRQILGWREFMRHTNHRIGRKQRSTNHFGFTRKMPERFLAAESGIVPFDTVMQKVHKTAYAHHIERLMVLGNFMLLCEIDPDEVYGFFMRSFIDACDWVMVGNVYGMSQYSDGGLMVTKPYISSSSYILKMSRYKKGEWCAIWDGLYWRFLEKHRHRLKNIPRIAMQLKLLDSMPESKRTGHIGCAERYLKTLE